MDNTDQKNQSWTRLPFYHGLLPAEDAHRLLLNDGDFLVRVVSLHRDGGRRQLVLTVRATDQVLELVVNERANGWAIDTERDFATPQELIAFYRQRPLSRVRSTKLGEAVERRDWQLRHSDIKLANKIGAGAYGTVFKAWLKREQDVDAVQVAVKQMEATACTSKEAIDCLMQEMRVMRQYDHPNVVKLLGVIVDHHPLMLVLELAEGGSVDNHLRRKGDQVNAAARIAMALGAARGLRYLHGVGCIHRDVATRNCLLVGQNHVKISDFGLTRNAEIYRIDVNKPVNVRWLAPEVWTTSETNRKTDVYAFGVTLWELFHRPFQLPYDGWGAATVKTKVQEGYRPKSPKDAPVFIVHLMKRCWSKDPQNRPTFDDIVHYLRTRPGPSSPSRRRSVRGGGSNSGSSTVVRVRKYSTD